MRAKTSTIMPTVISVCITWYPSLSKNLCRASSWLRSPVLLYHTLYYCFIHGEARIVQYLLYLTAEPSSIYHGRGFCIVHSLSFVIRTACLLHWLCFSRILTDGILSLQACRRFSVNSRCLSGSYTLVLEM